MRITNSVFLSLLIATGIALLIGGCTKDKYTTKPRLEFKSVNSYDVKQRDNLTFELGVTDKEGDIQNFVYMKTIVKHFPSLTKIDSFPVSRELPSTKDLSAGIEVCFSINIIDGGCPPYSARSTQNRDTTTFSFWIKDRANNVSDTVQTDKPIIIRN